MIKTFISFLFISFVTTSYIYAQRQKPPPLQKIHKLVQAGKIPRLRLSGYILHESFWDSRQVVGFQDDYILVFPQNKDLDSLGNDINRKGQYDALPIETRIRLEAHGPDIKGALTHGIIEADFFGKPFKGGEISNIIRMRHAFLELDWTKLTFIAGQTWHPMFVTDCFVDSISFNSGSPIDPYSRDPQIRLVYHHNNMNFIFAAASHLDQPNNGPDGFNTKYQRDAVVPNLHAQVQSTFHDNAILVGAGIDYQRIVPRLVTNKDIKTSESLNNISAIAYTTLKGKSITFSTMLSYVENSVPYGMIGGYAVKCIDPVTDKRKYTNLRDVSIWFDTALKKRVEPGLFVGYIKNIGAPSCIIQSTTDKQGNIENTIYGFGTDLDHVFRVSPRVRWYIKKLTIGFELEYTSAGYGTITDTGKVTNVDNVSNTRFLIAVFYNF